MDLVEVEAGVAVPVDTKRGKAPKIPEGAWEPERVQVCAQALILRENGYTVDHAVIYFAASRKRVIIPIDDALVARTRELIAQARLLAERPEPPPPLLDDPRCRGCSLAPICLPDEINALRTGAGITDAERATLRPIAVATRPPYPSTSRSTPPASASAPTSSRSATRTSSWPRSPSARSANSSSSAASPSPPRRSRPSSPPPSPWSIVHWYALQRR